MKPGGFGILFIWLFTMGYGLLFIAAEDARHASISGSEEWWAVALGVSTFYVLKFLIFVVLNPVAWWRIYRWVREIW